MRITVWNEGVHERTKPELAAIYPEGIHGAIAEGFRELLPAAELATATLDQSGQGLPDEALDATDVLLWWGHTAREPCDIPAPDELAFVSSFAGGEVFRSGVTDRRGRGRVFYFSPGDEAYPVYRHPQVRRVLANAVLWAAPTAPVGPPAPAAKTPRRDWHG